KFSRETQDAYAIESFKRAQRAQAEKKWTEITPVTLKSRKGEQVITEDEGPSKVIFEKVPTLRPAFDREGSVTAANASTINDGAAVLILASAKKAKELGLKPLGRILSSGTHAQAPEWFTTAPADAMKNAMKKVGWDSKDVDLFEVNE